MRTILLTVAGLLALWFGMIRPIQRYTSQTMAQVNLEAFSR